MRAEEYRRIAEVLRRAGADVELDAERVRRRLAVPAGADRAGPGHRGTGRGRRDMPRPRTGGGRWLPVLALSLVAAAVLVVSGFVAHPGPSSVQVIAGGTGVTPGAAPGAGAAPSGSGPARTSGNATRHAVAAPSPPDGAAVAPVPLDSRVDLGAADGPWLVAGLPGNAQVAGPGVVQGLGPVQVMGSGERVRAGPFRVTWPRRSGPDGASATWLVVPGRVRGVPAGLRVPLRLRDVPAVITVYTGTVGGAGRLWLSVQTADGAVPGPEVELPGCEKAVCPAVVRVALDPDVRVSGSLDVVVELGATGRNAAVGLAAVQVG